MSEILLSQLLEGTLIACGVLGGAWVLSRGADGRSARLLASLALLVSVGVGLSGVIEARALRRQAREARSDLNRLATDVERVERWQQQQQQREAARRR